ncbi:MAG TPA: sigma-70 family RNA polymerase sigma factor [Gemmataceae bacterium]|nr:sigma-70 family RNA polymerase sigma factor [Gemmataceae bacterium]
MPTEPYADAMGHLRKVALADAGLNDGELLDAYLARRDEAAFECLVWRHGPAVLGACRRILGNEADAEDAFQATFLVLVRKGHLVRPRAAVRAWLYGVACNVARKARADAARRRAKELATARPPAAPESADPDLRPTIDFEVDRLPEKYRVPVVLCELEGQPIAGAARMLGWPQGTMASRLARGRDLLARRLARHGLSVAGLVAAPLSAEVVAGALQASRGPGPSAAHRLADGWARSVLVTKVKVVTAAVACTAIVLLGGIAYRMSAGDKGDPPKDPPPAPADHANAERNSLVGHWKLTKLAYNGEPIEPPGIRRLVIAAELAQFSGIGLRSPAYVWKVDPTKSDVLHLNVVKIRGLGRRDQARFKLDGETLTVAVHYLDVYGVPGDPLKDGPPKSLTGEKGTNALLLTFERAKAERPDYERLVGRWRVTGSGPYRVLEFREQPYAGLLLAEGDKKWGDSFSWVIDERTDPRQINVSARVPGHSNPNQGIYKFTGDQLIIYLGAPLRFQGDPGKHTRPTSFEVEGKADERYLVLEREAARWTDEK